MYKKQTNKLSQKQQNSLCMTCYEMQRHTCLFICHSSFHHGQEKSRPPLHVYSVERKPPLHFLCLLMTEVLGVLYSRVDLGLKRGYVTVLEVELGHYLIRELGNSILQGREVIDTVVADGFL